jgi:Ca2+-binding RTX toxin-like protein
MAAINGTELDDSLAGSDGKDTLNGFAGDDTLSGAGGNDNLNGQSGDDTLYGGTGDDMLNGQQGADELYGEAGEDTLHGQTGDDTLDGGADDDRLTGHEGDDTLTGGDGADSFHYSFNVSEGTSVSERFTDWLITQGLAEQVDADGQLVDGTKQGDFNQLYGGWVEYLIDKYELNPDGKDVSLNLDFNDANGAPEAWIDGVNVLAGLMGEREDSTWTSGGSRNTVSHTNYYSDLFSFGNGLSASSDDGHDTITDFEQGVDRLDFSGLSEAQFTQLFDITQTDIGGDGIQDTVLSIAGDDSWSLTLIGVSDFTTSDIQFG